MSDFLSNVTARALGTAPVVLPRIPSLFEPYRANEGPYVVRPSSSSADATTELQESASGSGEPRQSRVSAHVTIPQSPTAEPFDPHAPTSQQGQQGLRKDGAEIAIPVQPFVSAQQRTAPASLIQPAQAPIAVRATGLRESSSPVSPSRGSQLGPAQTGTTEDAPSAAQQSNAPVQAVRPPRAQQSQAVRAPDRAGSVSESALQSAARPALRPLSAETIESTAGSAVPALHRVADAGGLPRAAYSPTAEASPVISALRAIDSAHQPAATPAETARTARPDYFARRLAPQLEQTATQQSSHRTGRPVQPPSLEIRPLTAVETAVRPSVAHSAEGAKTPVALSVASPAEPPIQITIGTVEVRAVFPEKAAPRAVSRRSKPGISLDDYLKQSSRGPR